MLLLRIKIIHKFGRAILPMEVKIANTTVKGNSFTFDFLSPFKI